MLRYKPISKVTLFILSMIPFVAGIVMYLHFSHIRHIENPEDRIMPTPLQIAQAASDLVFKADTSGSQYTTGEATFVKSAKRLVTKGDNWQQFRLLEDITTSFRIMIISFLAIMFVGMLLGLYMGMDEYMEALCLKFVIFFDKIPALAILPILFLIFPLGDSSKIALIVIGLLPSIVLDTYLRIKTLSPEIIIKTQTLAASKAEVIYKIVLKMIFPKVWDTLRLSLKVVVSLLIAAEGIEASAGMGYRMFVVKRFMAMDIILVYVFVISIVFFAIDWLMQYVGRKFPWANKD